jgi:hypothetical protein
MGVRLYLHLPGSILKRAAIGFLAVAAFFGLLFVLRNPKAPEAAFERAGAAVETAAEAGAPRYAPESYQLAEQAFGDAWLEMARQRGRLRIFRNYALADSLLETASRQALAAASAAADSAGSLKALAGREIQALKARLGGHRRALDSLLVNHAAERNWAGAEASLLVAENLIEASEFQYALDAAREGTARLDSLDVLLAVYYRDENRLIGVWRRWVQETLAASQRQGRYAVIVDKSAHKLYLVNKGKLARTFPCELGRNPAFQKLYAGDGATPEGKYSVTKVKNRGSKYYKALLLDYPNPNDRERFAANRANGSIPSGVGPGGYIEIHGMGGRGLDWTDGCVALTNEDMDAVLAAVGVGTPVTIVRKSDQWP